VLLALFANIGPGTSVVNFTAVIATKRLSFFLAVSYSQLKGIDLGKLQTYKHYTRLERLVRDKKHKTKVINYGLSYNFALRLKCLPRTVHCIRPIRQQRKNENMTLRPGKFLLQRTDRQVLNRELLLELHDNFGKLSQSGLEPDPLVCQSLVFDSQTVFEGFYLRSKFCCQLRNFCVRLLPLNLKLDVEVLLSRL